MTGFEDQVALLSPSKQNMASLALRSRLTARAFGARCFSYTPRLAESDQVPKPPPPIHDSTSALDYKRSHRVRPPPLPAMDLPRSRTAEEAVTNILYNTPPPSLQPFKKYVVRMTHNAEVELTGASKACVELLGAERAGSIIARVWDPGWARVQHRLVGRVPD